MNQKAVLIGALDTKGVEYEYVKRQLEKEGIDTIVVDTGVLGGPYFTPDVSSERVAELAGTSLHKLRKNDDRGFAVAAMTCGAALIMKELLDSGQVGGVFGMGGTAGTTVAASAMQVVPIGIPKMLVSTVASGNTRPYVGEKDITMMYSVVDISGINRLSSRILRNSASGLAGMIRGAANESQETDNRLTVGMTMFGVTTPCVTRVREIIEAKGMDVLVFHATGAGGMAMEELIRSGYIQGVADITTTELADELVGGIFTAGSHRLEAASAMKIPQVVSVGALDMVNFGPRETVPVQFSDRKFYEHNPTTTLMRTTIKENAELGEILAEKLNQSTSNLVLVFPKGGVSLLDRGGQAFEGIPEREALYKSLKHKLRKDIPFIELDGHINSPESADLIACKLLDMLASNY